MPVDLPPEVHRAAEGMVLGGYFEFVWDDGAQGAASVILRVDNDAAEMLAGRGCGTDYGPPPLDDLRGGAVVQSPKSKVLICRPGQEVTFIGRSEWPVETATVDSREVVAVASWDEVSGSIELVDLEGGNRSKLITTDSRVEVPVAASRDSNGIWALTLRSNEDDSATYHRYVFRDDEGQQISGLTSPQPQYGLTGFGHAAMVPEDGRLVFVLSHADNSADLVVWDYADGEELARHQFLAPQPDDPETSWNDVQTPEWVDANNQRAVINLMAGNGETHPSGALIVDLATGTVTPIGGRYGPLYIALASFATK